ncbi:MAG: hypothetical protein K0Q52_146 [Microbacterium sp.]|jgi:hypothetical protein|nr:hypothetical protein [Microbacterium sp.]
MSFAVETDQYAADALKESQSSSGNGKFPPLPRGEYQVAVVPLKKDDPSKRVEVADFGGTGPNGKKKVLRVALQIVDDSPLGMKRYFQVRIPLFTRFAPKDGAPQGKPAKNYFDFWGALGVSDEDLVAGRLPDVNFMMGKRLGVTISDPIEPDKWNPLGSNEVNFFNKAGDVNTTPRRTEGVPVAEWLNADDELIIEYPFKTPEAKAYIAELTGQAPAAVAAAGAGAPAPSWATQPGGAAPTGAPAPSWGTPPAANTALQDAAAAGGQGF